MASTAELDADKAEHASMLVAAKALELRIQKKSVEVATWAKAVAVVEDERPEPSPSSSSPKGEDPTSEPGKRRRGPKGAWRTIMRDLAKRLGKQEFGFADVAESGSLVGLSVNSDKIRSQMANYVNADWLERAQNGRFRFTENGLILLAGLSNEPGTSSSDKESPAADDAQAAGESSGPQSP